MKLIINVILATMAITTGRLAADSFLVRDLYDAGMPIEQAQAVAEAMQRQEAVREKVAAETTWAAEKAQIKTESDAMLDATFKRAMGR